ncbi:serine/threonine-protein kinase [Aspergillus ruber CBS 135680]|uniref:Putative calcium/calmodulin-dependent protein kinase n=1 Tax=Aspergillus ruber (strain CBS 135680) TaxID=1388766 RepID=A0A017SP19_ASPRC|nr:putative calcium/calmodulin-dependent protein kinase [Aspergillus ruber CBS 135680]EYE98005.1 putative calcium/calmodulin-dependent protein kinase [Aspergillus ruber CBS 135680]
MSTIQSLKNFIRHGKQARLVTPHAEPTTNVSPIHAQHQRQPQGASAAGNLDAIDSKLSNKQDAGHQKSPDGQSQHKRAREAEIEKIVAEERHISSQMPKYPGLERWVLLEKMGDGAFSNVYRAKDATGSHDQVAIKVVRKYEMNSTQRANILKEVQIMRQIDHPNVVKLIDFSEARQYYYIVLELCPGGELFHQIVRLTYFSEELSRHVILQVAKAIEYLHETSGVVHRDIKPENLLFYPIPFTPSKHPKPVQPGDEDKVDEGEFIQGVGSGGIGTIKIADFGLSKVIWDNQTMTPCGTVGYTAPEIVKDERYSKSVDMWALGCVLYTLLCGFPPFYDESIQVLTEKVARGQYTFLSPWWDEISKSAQDLISHLLTVDPEKRYTIREFLDHPWIRESNEETQAAADAPPLATPRPQQTSTDPMAAETPSIVDRPLDFRSPGAINLREVFDVGYAVRREEEEKKRRRNSKQAYKDPTARFQSALNPLNEASDDEEEERITYQPLENPPPKVHKSSQLAKDMASMEVKLRSTNLDAHANPPVAQKYPRNKADIEKKPIARGPREPFELSLNKATLLEKRGQRQQAA